MKKYTYEYVNAEGQSFGQKYTYAHEKYSNWAELRYALETNDGQVYNNLTYIASFEPLGPEDPLPSHIKLRRMVMPLGLRQHVPAEAHPKYLLAASELAAAKEEIERCERDILLKMHEDFTSYDVQVPGTTEADLRVEELTERCRILSGVCKSYKERAGVHPSTHPVVTETRDDRGVVHTIQYAKAPDTYVCPFCFRQGHHFKDACALFEVKQEPKDTTFKWGAAKMHKLK